jgi:hypothetical protein
MEVVPSVTAFRAVDPFSIASLLTPWHARRASSTVVVDKEVIVTAYDDQDIMVEPDSTEQVVPQSIRRAGLTLLIAAVPSQAAHMADRDCSSHFNAEARYSHEDHQRGGMADSWYRAMDNWDRAHTGREFRYRAGLAVEFLSSLETGPPLR